MIEVVNPKIQYRVDTGWADAVTGAITPILAFPTAESVGVYAAVPDWEPVVTYTDDDQVDFFDYGTVVEDVRFVNCAVFVRNTDITFRRCEFLDSRCYSVYAGIVHSGMVVEDCTFRFQSPGVCGDFMNSGMSVLASAGFTARRCAILDVNEGFGIGGSDNTPFDPDHADPWTVRIYECYARISGPPDCASVDWHGDVLQYYDAEQGGLPSRIRNCTFVSADEPLVGCFGTSAILCGALDSPPVDIDGFLCSGSSITFRVHAGGSVKNLRIVDDSWVFGPINVENWAHLTDWDAKTVTLDANGQPATIVNTIPYGYNGGPLDPP